MNLMKGMIRGTLVGMLTVGAIYYGVGGWLGLNESLIAWGLSVIGVPAVLFSAVAMGIAALSRPDEKEETRVTDRSWEQRPPQ